LRFFLDHDIDAAVGRVLRARGHQSWSAADAGLNAEADDTLTVYASDKGAVVVTHDKEFSQRRRKNVIGWHIQLRCNEWEAADLLAKHLDDLVRIMQTRDSLFAAVSHEGCDLSFGWN
jgi:predicted nuclease of predicted toxin-antitoxin system